MLKFFRKYNKFILAFGAAFLMLAFLIQPTLSTFMRGGEDQPIGHVDGQRLTVGDRMNAAVELEVLQRLHPHNPAMGLLADELAEGEALKWLLMKHDAQQLGLGASDAEVRSVLSALGLDEQDLALRARDMSVPQDYLLEAVRTWLTLEQYRDVILGQTRVPPVQRLQSYTRYVEWMQASYQAQDMMQQYQAMMQANNHLMRSFGTQRISRPLVEYTVHGQASSVAGEAVLVEADRVLDRVDEPTEAEMQEVFEQYRNVPSGEGEPYGFGYRIPDRVRLEYLGVPIDRVRRTIDIDEADALTYYDENRDRYRNDAEAVEAGEPEHRPYREVRQQVIRELRDREARAQASRIAAAARAELQRQVRPIPQEMGYRVLPDDFQPRPLREIADWVEQRFDVRPTVYDDMTEQWLAVDRLGSLTGIGEATRGRGAEGSFRDYVRSARELEPDVNHPLVSLHLQVGVPGEPMQRGDGSQYVFRLTDAQPAHAPESIDDVADDVRRDAHRQKAFAALLDEQEDWLSRARSQGLEALAESEDLYVVDVPPTPRRRLDQRGRLSVPSVPGIGSSEPFIDALFKLAERVSDDGEQSLTDAPEADRTGVAPAASRLALVLYRVDDYEPVTESEFREMAGQPQMASWVNQMLIGDEEEARASLSLEAVQRRVQFEAAEVDPDAEGDAPAGPQRRPGQL